MAHFAKDKILDETFSIVEDKIVKSDTSTNLEKNGPGGEKTVILTSSKVSGFNFDLDSMEVAKYSSELLDLINLIIKKSGLLNVGLIKFNERLAYDESERKKFKIAITKQGGYLDDDSNYFELPKDILTVGGNAICIRNSRVLLHWRNIQLTLEQKKKIISLGFAFLLGIITKAELLFWIKETIPIGIHEVRIKYKTDTFVLISIEEPVFSY